MGCAAAAGGLAARLGEESAAAGPVGVGVRAEMPINMCAAYSSSSWRLTLVRTATGVRMAGGAEDGCAAGCWR